MTTTANIKIQPSLHPSIVALDVISDLIREADGIAFVISRLAGTLMLLARDSESHAFAVTCEALNSEVAALFGALVEADARANTGIIVEAQNDDGID